MQKVVIIGAGPAGLTAAYELLKQSKENYEVTVLEGSQYIGGISRTVQFEGNRMDIGGHRFFSKDQRVMDWWKKILPLQGKPAYDDKILHRERPLAKGGPDPEKEDCVMLTRQRVSRIYYNKKFFDYPISMKPQTFINMGFVQTIKAGISYLLSCIHKLPEDSLENFYINRFGKVLYSMFFEGYTEKVWGRHPKEISADWGSQRVKGLSIMALIKNLFSSAEKETSLIEEFWYPKYGPGQLWEYVAEQAEQMGGTIIKGAEVKEVILSGDKVTGVVYFSGEERVVKAADYLLSSMPLKDLVCSMGEAVPRTIKTIAEGLPYRDFVTVGLLVDRLELKNKTSMKTLNNIVPDCWIYVQDVGVKMGRIQIFNNWSPYLVRKMENYVWIGLEYFCTEGDSFWEMGEEECISFAIDELVSMGIISGWESVRNSHRERVKKAYPAYFDTYSQIDELTASMNTYQNLYCIGRNGQHRYNNMDHSMATAFAAVDHILNGGNKAAIWDVNTEKEYHEKK
ncbi:FAD-dependent oxidoreductase [Clostridium sp. AF19-22AC]|uniref:NAD(P)/FAD-dependent oxidoreductase n=1 Tax=Clostridia TaxID=186801 RepID=UPI000E4DF343|nr:MULTISPECIES: NAD(P)/FAD-dependent oxidoreductase [Clostridia]RHR25825.1 FAD-dependent oxidoreductase [Clostridium sp. AF19-22AC]